MSRFSNVNKRTSLASIVLAAIALSILIISFTDVGKRLWFPQARDLESRTALTKPLRLEVIQSGDFEEILLSLRTFHYRAQRRGVAVYSDVYYDTSDWELYRNGYSYRFRERRGNDGDVDYLLRLEREPRFVLGGTKKIDLRNMVPAGIGDRIVQGAWEILVGEIDELEVTRRLSVVLEELYIEPQDLRPRLMAKLRRVRFDITDKGRNWFELDHEIWSFRPIVEQRREVQFEDVVIDTRLKKHDPELIRRVVTIKRLVNMIHGVRVIDRAPHERAIEQFRNGAQG